MENGIRAIIITVLSAVVIGMGAGWIQINSRISVVEVQVQRDHDMFVANQRKSTEDMEILIDKLNDIQIKVTQLGDLKADKEFK